MSRLQYRLDEIVQAFRTQGFGKGLQTIAERIRLDSEAIARWGIAYLKARNGYVILTIQGSKMLLPLDDPGISRELIGHGIRERAHTHLIQREIQAGMKGVDIGANIGYYALMEARQVGPAGLVIAVEPMPRNYEILCHNIKLNGYTQVVPLQKAIADHSGTLPMRITPQSNWCNMMSPEDARLTPSFRERLIDLSAGTWIQVPVTTLDDILAEAGLRQIDFIRMDIEGFEITATQGMLRTFREASSPLRLFVEIHNTHFQDPLAVYGPWFEDLFALGFRPRALAIPKHDPPILWDLSPQGFAERVCRFRNVCPHALLIKNG